MAKAASVEIGLVIYPGAQMAAVLGMTDVLVFADRLARRKRGDEAAPLLRVSHWAREDDREAPRRVFDTEPVKSGPVKSGLEKRAREGAAAPTVLALPPGLGAPLTAAEAAAFAPWLRERHAAGTALASICKGAFLLGETGLLAGRTVTTHWSYEAAFQARFPGVRLDTARLIVDDGDILTAGGVMAWTDLALKLIDRFLGPVVMMETAQTFLVDPPGREQSYYGTFSPRLSHGDGAILKVQHWLQATGARDVGLAALVAQSELEERTFLRRFQRATGLTSTDYCQRLRVGRARELLQYGTLSADQVAFEVGYADPGAFRKVFARIVGLSPADYRRRFRA